MSSSARTFSIAVISRILRVLAENDHLKRSNLAGKTSLNYLVCMKYVKLLKALSLISYSSEDGEISITDAGKRFNLELSSYLASERLRSRSSDSSKEETKASSDSIYSQEHQSISSADDRGKSFARSTNDTVIMIVDDEPDALLTYKLFLTEAGYVVDVFVNARDAIRRLASEDASKYKLIISDIRMPGINGLKLYQRVKEMNKDFKFVFVTALDAADELLSVMPDVDSTQIIRKPVDRERFLQAVRKALDGNGHSIASKDLQIN